VFVDLMQIAIQPTFPKTNHLIYRRCTSSYAPTANQCTLCVRQWYFRWAPRANKSICL